MPADAPHISVVVPTFRRPALLARCLAALAAQTLAPARFEVVVADNAGAPETRRAVEETAANCEFPVLYVDAAGAPGPAYARNAGWRLARGAIVAFTDDDCVPDAGWLTAGLEAFAENPDAAAATGRLEMPLPAAPTDYELNEYGLTTAEFVTANCFVRRAWLAALGGFDERFTAAWREDSDLHFRLLAGGARIVAAPRARVVHPIRPARFGVSLGQQRKSMFDALLYRKHPRLYRAKIGGAAYDYYLQTAALAAGAAALLAGRAAAQFFLLVAAALAARFCARRLERTARAPAHVAEMIVTSALIPPVAVFWRLYGAWRFRVLFF